MAEQDVIPPSRPQRPSSIRNLLPRLPIRGNVKIGGLGATRKSKAGNDYQMPVKYEAFRVTTLERGQDGNFVVDEALHNKVGLGQAPTEIPIRLLYDDPDLNLQTRYAAYAGKTLWCSGDGVEAYRASKEYGQPAKGDPFRVTCPCHRQNPEYKGDDKCKINGRLSMMIEGAGGVGGVWVFRTTSYNSVTGLASSLMLLRAISGGILANIPLKLKLQPKQATSPTDGAPVRIFVVSVEFDGDISELQQMGHRIALERATAHMSITHIEDEARRLLALPLPENAVLPGDDAEDIVDEFYPEQNGHVPVEDEPRPTREQFQEPETTDETPHDPETGEIIDNESQEVEGEEETPQHTEHELEVLAEAIEAAKSGAATFRAFWGLAEKVDRALILPDLGKYQEMAERSDFEKGVDPDPTKAGAVSEDTAPASTAPPKEPAASVSAGPGPTATKTASPSDDDQVRPAIFTEDNWKIVAPLMQNKKVNFPMLRDRLCALIGFCDNDTDLTKLAVDNKAHLEALVISAPQYAETVQAMIDTRRQVLGQ